MSTIDAEQRAKAVQAMRDAWALAEEAGVPADVIAGVALAKAYTELTAHMGKETAANIAARFADEITAGRFGEGAAAPSSDTGPQKPDEPA